MNAKSLVISSILCERMFSVAGHALVEKYISISNVYCEEKKFLYANSDLWGIQDVNEFEVSQSKYTEKLKKIEGKSCGIDICLLQLIRKITLASLWSKFGSIQYPRILKIILSRHCKVLRY